MYWRWGFGDGYISTKCGRIPSLGEEMVGNLKRDINLCILKGIVVLEFYTLCFSFKIVIILKLKAKSAFNYLEKTEVQVIKYLTILKSNFSYFWIQLNLHLQYSL